MTAPWLLAAVVWTVAPTGQVAPQAYFEHYVTEAGCEARARWVRRHGHEASGGDGVAAWCIYVGGG